MKTKVQLSEALYRLGPPKFLPKQIKRILWFPHKSAVFFAHASGWCRWHERGTNATTSAQTKWDTHTHTHSAPMLATGGRHQASLHFFTKWMHEGRKKYACVYAPFLKELVETDPLVSLVHKPSSSSRKLRDGCKSVKTRQIKLLRKILGHC